MQFGLALRDRRLTSPRTRGQIAAGIESVIEDAENGAHGMSSQAPTQRRLVLDARPELQELVDRLGGHDAVRPRGVAMSVALLTDASGPLYRAGDPGALRRAVLAATYALEDGRRF